MDNDETPVDAEIDDEAATGLPGAPRRRNAPFQRRRPIDRLARARFGPGMYVVLGVGAFVIVVSLGVFAVQFASAFLAPPQRVVSVANPTGKPSAAPTPYFEGTDVDESGFGGVDPGPDAASTSSPTSAPTQTTTTGQTVPQPQATSVDFAQAVRDGQARGAGGGAPNASPTVDPYAPDAATRHLADGPNIPDPQGRTGGTNVPVLSPAARQVALEQNATAAAALRAQQAPVEVALSGNAAQPVPDPTVTPLILMARATPAAGAIARTPDPAYSGNPAYAAAAARSSSIYTPDDVRTPVYPYAVLPDSMIPVRIYVPVDTQVSATTLPVFVDADVHDELNHKDVLLIPKGTRAMCSADTTVNPGQSRLNIICTALVFANGYTRTIGAMALADAHGQIGIPGRVNNHAGAAYIAILPLAILGAATQIASGPQQIVNGVQSQTIGQAVSQNAAGQLAQVGTAQIQQKLSIPPTIHLDAGIPASMMVDRILGFSQPFPFGGSP